MFLVAFLLLESIRCQCNASELKDKNIEIKRNERILTDYNSLSESSERFHVRCKRDRIGRYVWTGHCNERNQFEFVRKQKKLEGTIVDYCRHLRKSCYVPNVPYEIKFDSPNNNSIVHSNTFMDFYCRSDPSKQRVGQIMCVRDLWQYKMGGKASFEYDVESHCERFVTGCKNEYKPQFHYFENFDGFDYQKHLFHTTAMCHGYAGNQTQTAVCINGEWQIWDNGVKINVSDEEFCNEKRGICPLYYLPIFIEEGDKDLNDEDGDKSHRTSLSIHCKYTTKTAPLSARCNHGRWSYMKDNSPIDLYYLELYCNDAEDKCHFYVKHIHFLQKPLGSLSNVSRNEITHFSCQGDNRRREDVEARCVLVSKGRSSLFEWQYSLKGTVVSEEDVVSHCTRYSNGCESSVDFNLQLYRQFPEGYDYQRIGTQVDVKCKRDFGGSTQVAVCGERGWEYRDNGVDITQRIRDFCEDKRNLCFTSSLPDFIADKDSLVSELEDSKIIPIRCPGATEGVSINARCNRGNWVYTIDGLSKNFASLQSHCNEFPSVTQILLIDSSLRNTTENRTLNFTHNCVNYGIVFDENFRVYQEFVGGNNSECQNKRSTTSVDDKTEFAVVRAI